MSELILHFWMSPSKQGGSNLHVCNNTQKTICLLYSSQFLMGWFKLITKIEQICDDVWVNFY